MNEAEQMTTKHRELRGFSTEPLPVEVAPDYSESLLAISLNAVELTHAMPNGQSERVVKAFLTLEAAVPQLRAWLEAKGVLSTDDINRRKLQVQVGAEPNTPMSVSDMETILRGFGYAKIL